ncbi:MAG: 2-C-methyl-D-erythritol 4-phosphate cytidylyltransferase [Actinobacteria bacterium]|nr:2-C-methyl-D-erythritol 4-phosphate cytidylyltransferase [Actinomycetota bacterium]
MRVWAIVVAAGTGSRFGRPKQFELLGGRSLLDWSSGVAAKACDDVVVVRPRANSVLSERMVFGGATRSESVRNGLAAVPPDVDIVVVHDAARPLASADLFHAVIGAVEAGADAAIPAVPVTDTVKRVDGGRVAETLDRSTLVAVQTPQAFRAAVLRAAHASGREATDDAALVEALGGTVVVVPGETTNIKVTTPADLRIAEVLRA